jgi:hypothetical protein
MLVEIETGSIEWGTVLKLKFVVRKPDGFQALEQEQAVPVADSLVKRSRFLVNLELSGSQSGVWRIQVVAGGHVIGELPIEIRLPIAEPDPASSVQTAA